MNRRDFLILLGSGVAAWPFGAHGQQEKLWRIGMLETISPALNAPNLAAFRNGLRQLGYVESQSYVIEYRSVEGRAARFPELDIIVTRGTPATLAAKNATATIPVVMAAIGEPLDTGVVTSLSRPGGNVTGFSSFVTELVGKRVELFKEAMPNVMRIGFLNNMGNPVIPPQWEETKKAARSLALRPSCSTCATSRISVALLKRFPRAVSTGCLSE